MSELEALRWIEAFGVERGAAASLWWIEDEDARKHRWFASVAGSQAWGDRLVDSLVALRAKVEAKA